MRTLIVGLILVLSCGSAAAESESAANAAQIRALLSSMFDKPGSKVRTDPVVVVKGHAIAGWTQGKLAGRALLRKESGGWILVACGGDAMKEVKTLRDSGIVLADAHHLAAQVDFAEAKIPEARRKRFATFGPVVDAAAMHGTGAGHHTH